MSAADMCQDRLYPARCGVKIFSLSWAASICRFCVENIWLRESNKMMYCLLKVWVEHTFRG